MSCYRSVPSPPYTIDCFLDNTNYVVQTWDSKFDLALLCFFFFPDAGASTDITKIYRAHMLGKWKVCQFSLRLNALNMSGQIVSAWIFSFSTCTMYNPLKFWSTLWPRWRGWCFKLIGSNYNNCEVWVCTFCWSLVHGLPQWTCSMDDLNGLPMDYPEVCNKYNYFKDPDQKMW